MTRNQSMTEVEWRQFKLWRDAGKLSSGRIKSLETQLLKDPTNMDLRIQLLGYYGRYKGNNLKHTNAHQKLFELVLWLIQNEPSVGGLFGHRISTLGHSFRPRIFAALREAWLEQVAATPLDGRILGNAASFIAWNDIETASDLFDRAYILQPEQGWYGTFVIHLHSQLWDCPEIYKRKIRERIIDVGVRSLETELGGAPFLTCEYVSDAALSLGQYELVLWCADILAEWNSPTCSQKANAYRGLVALRENDRQLASQLMLKMEFGFHPQAVVFRLARELFDVGERDSIVQLVESFKRSIKTAARKRWLEQIANNQPPDFEDYC